MVNRKEGFSITQRDRGAHLLRMTIVEPNIWNLNDLCVFPGVSPFTPSSFFDNYDDWCIGIRTWARRPIFRGYVSFRKGIFYGTRMQHSMEFSERIGDSNVNVYVKPHTINKRGEPGTRYSSTIAVRNPKCICWSQNNLTMDVAWVRLPPYYSHESRVDLPCDYLVECQSLHLYNLFVVVNAIWSIKNSCFPLFFFDWPKPDSLEKPQQDIKMV